MDVSLFSFDKIPSTQIYAHELVATGRAKNGMIVSAKAQSAGRGRYRRTWVSHHGNLYVSFIYESPERQPVLSYAVAVAVAEALIQYEISPTIKWPNDILIDNKKVCGILIEYARKFVIIGIGVNIKSNPSVPGASYQTTKLDDYKKNISPEELLFSIKSQIDKWMHRDFKIVRARWTELANGLGTTIIYKGRPAVLCGINDNGALVLQRGSEYVIAFGDEISI